MNFYKKTGRQGSYPLDINSSAISQECNQEWGKSTMRMLSVKPDHRKEAASEMATIENTRAYDCRHYNSCLTGAALVDMKTMPCSG